MALIFVSAILEFLAFKHTVVQHVLVGYLLHNGVILDWTEIALQLSIWN